MSSKNWSSIVDETQLARIEEAINLLQPYLDDSERIEGGEAYRLGWYLQLRKKRCRQEEIEEFRRFVDDMSERARQRAQCTNALFPLPDANSYATDETGDRLLRARELCESFCADVRRAST